MGNDLVVKNALSLVHERWQFVVSLDSSGNLTGKIVFCFVSLIMCGGKLVLTQIAFHHHTNMTQVISYL
jgi:hypothetical protein